MNQETAQLFKELYLRDVCLRCIFRIIGQTDINQYRDRTQYVELLCSVGAQLGDEKQLIELYDFKNMKQKSEPIPLSEFQPQIHSTLREFEICDPFYSIQNGNNCSVCQGILQVIDDPVLLNSIVENIKQRDYIFDAFKFSVKTPIGVQIRQSAVVYDCVANLGQSVFYDNITSGNIIVDIKVVIKWVISGLLSEALQVKSNAYDDRFQINLQFENLKDDIQIFKPFKSLIEVIEDQAWEEKITKKLKMNDPQLKAETHHRLMQKKHHSSAPFLPTQSNLEKIKKLQIAQFRSIQREQSNYQTKISLTTQHANIFIKGNYIKLGRFISQTPWLINDNKMYEDNIQDLVSGEAIRLFKPTTSKFHSGGREDIDVRMLGSGRPFMLELVDPHRVESTTEILQQISNSVNQSSVVKVVNLQFTDQTCFMDLKDSETNKVKAYCCIVKTDAIVTEEQIKQTNQVCNLSIFQKTPIRVLHRRTLLTREKKIHALKIVPLNQQWMQVYVLSSAGTYIKEFIHSDLDRTLPNLGTLLGTQCDIFQLDVMKLYTEYNQETLQDFYQLDSEQIQ